MIYIHQSIDKIFLPGVWMGLQWKWTARPREQCESAKSMSCSTTPRCNYISGITLQDLLAQGKSILHTVYEAIFKKMT